MRVKKTLIYSLSILLILIGTLSFYPEKAKASGYSPEAALAYAADHWNDGKGLCAEFVSDCVIAGGLEMPVCPMVYYCVPAIVNASGVQPQTLKLDEWGLATKELDGDILAPGDVVFHYCNTHPDSIRVMPHIIICAGYDEEGYAVYYAHNGACNKRRIRLNINTAYEHERDCDMVGKVIHLSGGPTGYNPSGAYYFEGIGDSTDVEDDNIKVSKSVILNDAPTSNVTSVTFKISDEDGNKLGEKDLKYSIENDIIHFGVDVKKDLNIALTKGKYYIYEFCVNAGQLKLRSANYSVLATKPITTLALDEEELSMDSYLEAAYDPSVIRDDKLSSNDGNLLISTKKETDIYIPKLVNPGKIISKKAKSVGRKRVFNKASCIFSKNGYGLCKNSYYKFKNLIYNTKIRKNIATSDENITISLFIINSELGRRSKHLLRVRG